MTNPAFYRARGEYRHYQTYAGLALAFAARGVNLQRLVLEIAPAAQIKAALAEDPNLNNISLHRWDQGADAIRSLWPRDVVPGALWWSLSQGCCVLKWVARHVIAGEPAPDSPFHLEPHEAVEPVFLYVRNDAPHHARCVELAGVDNPRYVADEYRYTARTAAEALEAQIIRADDLPEGDYSSPLVAALVGEALASHYVEHWQELEQVRAEEEAAAAAAPPPSAPVERGRKAIAPDVLTTLSNCTTDGAALFLPKGKLERPAYVAVNAVLESLGGKWNRKAQAHLFDGDAGDLLESVLLTGCYVSLKDVQQELGQFYTPAALAAEVVELADVQEGHAVLEPSAGTGAIALAAAAKGAKVICVELDPANVTKLRALGFITADRDFLGTDVEKWGGGYDRVVMNPPFAKQADVRHVLHALGFLKPGGVLVAIMSASVAFRENGLAIGFRELVESSGGTITPLPDGSFKASGTGVNTVVVRIPAPLS